MTSSLERARLTHKPLANVLATLKRAAKPSVVAGIEVELFEAEITPTNKWKFAVEKKEPRRIVQWETPSLAKAELIKSARLKYLELNQPEGQSYLQKLGLRPRPARTM